MARGWVARERSRLSRGDSARQLLQRAIGIANDVLGRDSASATALELRGNAGWTLAVGTAGGTLSANALAGVRRDLEASLARDSTRVIAAATLAQLVRVTARNDDDRLYAIRLARQAWERDAFLASAEGAMSQLYRATYALGQLDSARAWCDRGRELAPADWRFAECPLVLMRVNLRGADPAQAWATVLRLEELDSPEKAERSGRPYSPIYRRLVAAAVSAARGQRDSARAVLARELRAVEGNPELRIDIKHDETLVRLALGDRTEGMRALREYLEHRPEFYGAVLGDRAWRQFGLDSARIAVAIAAR